MNIKDVENKIRDIVDFPEKGIVYKDITPLLQDPKIFEVIIDEMLKNYSGKTPDYIVGVESRGFIFGAVLASKLGCGFIPVRKKGKLPYNTIEESYDLEYGSATLEIHTDAVKKGDKVVIVDDLLATGGTVNATVKLLERLNSEIIGIEFLIELDFLNGREILNNYMVNSLINVK